MSAGKDMAAGRRGRIVAFLADYRQRHCHPVNAALHLFGVPMAFAGLYFLVCGSPVSGLGLICAGYALQWAGHRVQGNEVGEVTLMKAVWRRLQAGRGAGDG